MSYGLVTQLGLYQQWSDSKWRTGCFQLQKGHPLASCFAQDESNNGGSQGEALSYDCQRTTSFIFLIIKLFSHVRLSAYNAFYCNKMHVRGPFAGVDFCLPLCGFRGWNLACVLICWPISPDWYSRSYSQDSVLRQCSGTPGGLELLCRWGWPWTPHPPASLYWVLGLQAHTTMPGL